MTVQRDSNEQMVSMGEFLYSNIDHLSKRVDYPVIRDDLSDPCKKAQLPLNDYDLCQHSYS